MKKIFLSIILSTVYSLLSTVYSYAVSPTSTPPIPQDTTEQQINQLKERIASRVAELKLVERRGIMGTVTEVTDTQITLGDAQDNTRFVDVDELTKFSSPSVKEGFGISDIKKGTGVGILGLYNKQSKRILARFVDVVSQPKRIHGAVSSVDNENFTISITSENKDKTVVDIETVTKTFSFTKASGLARSGFSKIKLGQNIVAVGFYDIKNKTHLIASRIIIFPDIPPNLKITISQENFSTDSGKK